MYQVCKIKDQQLLFCDQIIFFKTEFKKSEAEEAENKKDNPKEILYEFLNLIGNQEKNLFAPPVFKNQLMLQKKRLNFKSIHLEDLHLSQDFEMSEKLQNMKSTKRKKCFLA